LVKPQTKLLKIARVALAVVLAALAVRAAPYLAPIHAHDLAHDGQAIEFVDRNGLPLGTILTRDQQHTAFVPLSRVAPQFVQAIVAAEDRRFYRRGPIDAAALARSVLQLLQTHRVVSGGSTIPMQLARMIDGLPSGVWGKTEQIWIAMRIAAGMSRGEILEAYVNRLPMGGNIYGVEAAARTYFAAPASSLDLAQATLLAALPNDPTGLDPYAHLDALRIRQRYVLDRMVTDGEISRNAADRAAAEELSLAPRRAGIIAAPHFLFWLASSSPDLGAHVTTTIDRPLQQFVEEQVRQVMRQLAARNVRDAAALVVDNESGQLLAYAGSPDYFDDAHAGRNDGVQALRQPGSALKPFLYEYALETRAIHPNTILADVPVVYAIPGHLVYTPSDYSDTFSGPVRVRIALADSLNVPAVKVLERVGVDSFLTRLHALGFAHLDKSPDYYGLGLTLGGGEVSLFELARAYVTAARGGRQVELSGVLRAQGSSSNADDAYVGDAQTWQLVTDMLADAHARARSFGVRSALNLPFAAAVKTGTSSDFRDTWTVGYTPEYTVAVWVGNFDGEPMRRVSGVAGAAPLWGRIMLHLYESREPVAFEPPQGLALRPICATTGLMPGAGCASVVDEYLYPEDLARYDTASAPARLSREYDGWLALQPSEEDAGGLRIVRPQPGAYFVIQAAGSPLAVPRDHQRIGFLAAGARSRPVSWLLNGKVVGQTRRDEPFFWTLRPGTYSLVARSGSASDSVRFAVGLDEGDLSRVGFSVRPR
jgi:penicillin-binding protein 1C